MTGTIRVCIHGNTCASWVRSRPRIGANTRRGCRPPNRRFDSADHEAKAPPPAAGNQAVQLGIGTLIIIAIIVSMCSGGGEVKELRSDTQELKRQMGEINQKLDALLAKQASAPATNDP